MLVVNLKSLTGHRRVPEVNLKSLTGHRRVPVMILKSLTGRRFSLWAYYTGKTVP